ncbi:hypothetical protein HMPREF9349_01739 [Escherichia coli MS 79-10]|nr:hypothetical protein HMPREF9349_01739 [Escherichia coli MS 79-10]
MPAVWSEEKKDEGQFLFLRRIFRTIYAVAGRCKISGRRLEEFNGG